MSYILDALRRADLERERGQVPGIHALSMPPALDIARAAPRAARWFWTLAAAGTLLAGVLAWLLASPEAPMRTPPQMLAPATPAPVRTGAADRAAAPAVLPAVTAHADAAARPASTVAAAAAPIRGAADPAAAPAVLPTVTAHADAAARPASAVAAVAAAPAPATPGTALARGAGTPAAPVAAATTSAAATPVAARASTPAREAAPSAPTRGSASAAPPASPGPGPSPAAATEPRIHALHELPDEVRRAIPPLVVNGSVYSRNPADRFLIVNGQIVHESEPVAPDVVLEKIGQRAAVLSALGHRFEISY